MGGKDPTLEEKIDRLRAYLKEHPGTRLIDLEQHRDLERGPLFIFAKRLLEEKRLYENPGTKALGFHEGPVMVRGGTAKTPTRAEEEVEVSNIAPEHPDVPTTAPEASSGAEDKLATPFLKERLMAKPEGSTGSIEAPPMVADPEPEKIPLSTAQAISALEFSARGRAESKVAEATPKKRVKIHDLRESDGGKVLVDVEIRGERKDWNYDDLEAEIGDHADEYPWGTLDLLQDKLKKLMAGKCLRTMAPAPSRSPAERAGDFAIWQWTVNPANGVPPSQMPRWSDAIAKIGLFCKVPQEECEAIMAAALERGGATPEQVGKALGLVREIYDKFGLGEDRLNNKQTIDDIRGCGLKVGEYFLTGSPFMSKKATDQKYARVPNTLSDLQYTPDGSLDTQKLSPFVIAQHIIDNLHIITMRDSGEMYYYRDGRYRPKGEPIVDEAVQMLMRECTTNRLVGEVRGQIRRCTGYDREQLNADKEWLCVRNGLLNIYTRELRPHYPEFKTIIGIPVIYNPNARCPKIDEYLSAALLPSSEEPDGGWWGTKRVEGKATPQETMKIRKDTVYEVFGYTFDPLKRLQKAALFYGPPGSCKSTTARLLAAMLGQDNVSAVSLENLTGSEFAGGAIEGKLANICSEMSGRTLKATEALMRWVGNEDVKFERKGKDAHFAPPNINFIFTCNTTTPTSDCPSGYYRRWLMVPFLNQIPESERNDAHIKPLFSEQEMSGLLNESLNGLDRIIANGKFSGTMTDESTAELYDALSDTVRVFFQERCEIRDPERTEESGVGTVEVFCIPTEDLYSAYKNYCRSVKLSPVSRNRFPIALVKASGNQVYEKNVDTYCGSQRIHKKAIHNLTCAGVEALTVTRRR